MAEIKVNPTRMELKKMKTRYATARRGHKLLKDKRDGLMKKFLESVREAKTLREEVEARLSDYYGSFSVAAATTTPAMLEEALIIPKAQIKLDMISKNIMSVNVPIYDLETFGENRVEEGCNYGFAFTSAELDSALSELNQILGSIVKLAESEKTVQLLAEEIEKTRRRVNALEYIMIPSYETTIKSIKMKLEENERGNTTRLMKVKDMMVKQSIENAHGAIDTEDDSDAGVWVEE